MSGLTRPEQFLSAEFLHCLSTSLLRQSRQVLGISNDGRAVGLPLVQFAAGGQAPRRRIGLSTAPRTCRTKFDGAHLSPCVATCSPALAALSRIKDTVGKFIGVIAVPRDSHNI